MNTQRSIPEQLEISAFGETHASLRLSSEVSVREMRESLERHGQLTPIAAYPSDAGCWEIVDGFKRLRAARLLQWSHVRFHAIDCNTTAALASMMALNTSVALTDLEQAWLCRALCREHGLAQYEVARLLGRHKSWVCRRLLLVESLEPAVQVDIRVGVLAPRAAVELARLPRGNQVAASELVMRRGMSVRQTTQLVQQVMAQPTPATRDQWLADALARPEMVLRPVAVARREKTPAEWLLGDIESATRVASRLQVRLRERPLCSFDSRVAVLLQQALVALQPVMERLLDSVARAAEGKDLRDATME
jgi:ParB/RepB/Spo0J family partition protein